jgi:hypothetical protein
MRYRGRVLTAGAAVPSLLLFSHSVHRAGDSVGRGIDRAHAVEERGQAAAPARGLVPGAAVRIRLPSASAGE